MVKFMVEEVELGEVVGNAERIGMKAVGKRADQIGLGDRKAAGLGGRLRAGDDNRDYRGGQMTSAQDFQEGTTQAGSVADEGCAVVEGRIVEQSADVIDDRCIKCAAWKSVNVTKITASGCGPRPGDRVEGTEDGGLFDEGERGV